MRAALHFAYWLIFAFALGLFLRLFVMAIYLVPSPSMVPTIMSGDFILAIKPLQASQKLPKRGEVWLFRKPYHEDGQQEVMVKRLFGIPGDTVSIVDGAFSVNSEISARFDLTHGIISVNTFSYPSIMVFPNDTTRVRWTGFNFGPLWVPSKGCAITLNETNKVLYRKVIIHESPEIRVDSIGCFWRDGAVIDIYTFMENYYFACGDNLILSNDSRHWGFVPESHLLSKAKLVLVSSDLASIFKSGRFLKAIR